MNTFFVQVEEYDEDEEEEEEEDEDDEYEDVEVDHGVERTEEGRRVGSQQQQQQSLVATEEPNTKSSSSVVVISEGTSPRCDQNISTSGEGTSVVDSNSGSVIEQLTTNADNNSAAEG